MMLVSSIALIFAAVMMPMDLKGVSLSEKISEHGRLLLAQNVTFATHAEKNGKTSTGVTVADCYNSYYTYYVSFACPSGSTAG